MFKEIHQDEICSGLVIKGVDCVAWAHPQEFPYNVYDNNQQVIDKITPSVSAGSYAVSVDSFMLSNMSEGQHFFVEPIDEFITRGFAQTGNYLLLGDFLTAYAEEKKNEREKIKMATIGTLIAGSSGILGVNMLLRQRSRHMSRRDFLKVAGTALAAIPISLVALRYGMKMASENDTSVINRCDFDNPTLKITDITKNAFDTDLVFRTGLMIAKQSAMYESGYYDERNLTLEGNKSVWGTDHLRPKFLTQVKEIAENPQEAAEYLIDRDIEFYLKKDLPTDEIAKLVASTSIDMAGIAPLRVTKVNGVIQFNLPVVTGDDIFIDDRITGMDSSGMNRDELYRNLFAKVYDKTLSFV